LVGLGNVPLPNTRHNVGMMTLDHIAKALGLTWSRHGPWKADKAETSIRIETTHKSETIIKEYNVTLLKPRKLMNISGSCVAQAGKKEKKKKR
jgi:PTH1 family peptidyl-tRNA hydrolase